MKSFYTIAALVFALTNYSFVQAQEQLPAYSSAMKTTETASIKNFIYITTQIQISIDSLHRAPFNYSFHSFDTSKYIFKNYIDQPSLDMANASMNADKELETMLRAEMKHISLQAISIEMQKQSPKTFRVSADTFMKSFNEFIALANADNGASTNSSAGQYLFDFSGYKGDMTTAKGRQEYEDYTVKAIKEQLVINEFINSRKQYQNKLMQPYTRTDSLFLQIIKWQLLDNVADLMNKRKNNAEKWMNAFMTLHYINTKEYPEKTLYASPTPELMPSFVDLAAAIQKMDTKAINKFIMTKEVFTKRLPGQNYDSTIKALTKDLKAFSKELNQNKISVSASNTIIKTITSEFQMNHYNGYFIYNFKNQLVDLYATVTVDKEDYLMIYRDVYWPFEKGVMYTYIAYAPVLVKLSK